MVRREIESRSPRCPTKYMRCQHYNHLAMQDFAALWYVCHTQLTTQPGTSSDA